MRQLVRSGVRSFGIAPFLLTACLSGCAGGDDDPEEGGEPDEIGVRFLGRVDVADPQAPRFAWSGSGFSASVAGTSIAVSLRSDAGSDAIYFQPVIDGTPGERFSVASSEGPKTVTIGSALADGDHQVELYRETEGKPGFAYSTFLGFTEGALGARPAASARSIEIIGDSISAGYGNLGSEEHPNYGPDPSGGCRFSTETESAYRTYGMLAGRAVGAHVSIIAASGWGIYSDNGGNQRNVLPAIFPNAVGGQPMPLWDFVAQPQAVVINLGTNDFSADMSLGQEPFTTAFTAFLATVREKYPDAWIYCAIGPLLFATGLSSARVYIPDMVASLNAAGDAKIKVLDFGQQNILLGSGCDYHPNVQEHQRLADLLVAQLRADLGW